jgi:CRISPR system Cascade subunit CasA
MDNFSLLDDALFSVCLPDGSVERLTLPDILDRLSSENLLSFEALQAHQQQAWYSFLVQLAAMAVAREADGELPSDPAGWRDVLAGLADGSEAAWQLVVGDLSEPAFLQSPMRNEDSLDEAGYKSDLSSPDDLDMLVTSKNHDVKQHRISNPRAEHWIFALVTLQTLEGYMGRGNYGIVRMNGAYANRPLVGLTPELSWGKRFRRDLTVLLGEREQLADTYELDGPALLWTAFWDGSKEEAIPLHDCDPYFIEICRRIRFTEEDGTLACWRTNTKGQRLDAPDSLDGITGDPWTPIDLAENKVLTLGGEGFTYQKLQEIFLSDAYKLPPALRHYADDDEVMYLTARAMVRGQGKTEGLHRRIVPVPPKVSPLLQRKTDRRRLAARAKERVALADETQRTVLYPSFAALLTGGQDRNLTDREQDRVGVWTSAFDRALDARFFESLWDTVEQTSEESAADWQDILRAEAEEQFDEAKRSTPLAAAHRWRALSKAQSIFDASVRRVLPRAFPEHDGGENGGETTPADESPETEAPPA